MVAGVVGQDETIADGVEELIFDPSNTPHSSGVTLMVKCQSGSSASVLIRVAGLHTSLSAGEGVRIDAGEREYFRLGTGHLLGQVWATGDGGTATIDWGLVAALKPSAT